MDVAALIVAIFAAIAALGSLGWQHYMWNHERRLRIAVDLEKIDVVDKSLYSTEVTVFRVAFTNRSAFPVRVDAVTLVPAGQRVRSWTADDPSLGLPRDVRPNDAEHIDLPSSLFFANLPDGPVEG